MAPFEPAAGRARWRILYDHLATLGPGDVYEYTQMAEALNLDPQADRHVMQKAMRRAAKTFAEENRHAVEPVPNRGYRVAAVDGHVTLARRHQRKSQRSIVRAKSAVTYVDLDGVDPGVRHTIDLMAQALSMQVAFSNQLDVRQRNLERAVGEIKSTSSAHKERTDEELAELRGRLDRLERGE